MAALRADAQRNLSLVLDAAGEAFAECGPDVSIDEIARRAGVGHGTVCRRFPTKDSLMAAVVGARLDELAAATDELLARPDAGAAFEDLVWRAAELFNRDRALFDGSQRCDGFQEVAEAKQQLNEKVERLIRKARRAGALRRDLAASDVGALIGSTMQAAMRADDPDAWRRYVRILLDGLRPPARKRSSRAPDTGSASALKRADTHDAPPQVGQLTPAPSHGRS
jgi:AcrR family transcriptional regulator